MEIPLLPDIVTILGLSVFVILIFQKFKLPTIVGFLITGIVAGPHGLSLVAASHEVEILSEIGVILLLFIIGLEFSLKSLAAIKKEVFIGGIIQVGITVLAVALIAYYLNFSTGEAIFLGFLFSLSSTAIVLKLLQESGEVSTPHGKIILAVLIFQDIIVVPMMLFTPMIAGESENIIQSLLILALKGALVIAVVIVSARYLVPHLLYQVAKTKSKELFILSTVVICFSVAWLTSSIGLSLALGAFMAGLIISESEYSHQATSNIIPFREVFTSFFFVSIGMLLNLTFLWSHLPIILLLTFGTFIIKGTIAAVAALVLKYPLRTGLLVGLSIFQVGEFAFILSRTGLEYEVLSPVVYQYFLSVSILTMAVTPFIIKLGETMVSLLLKAPIPKRLRNGNLSDIDSESIKHEDLNDHIVIIGFGINGKNLAKAAKQANIPYVILELNAETVKKERLKGELIYYGDAVQENILSHVAIHKARVVVIGISDRMATKRIIVNIKSISTKVFIIVRTRFFQEMDDYFNLGANEVIPEDFETSIEIFTRVLTKYLIPRDQIEGFIRNIRSDDYEMLRSYNPSRANAFPGFDLPDVEIATLTVQRNSKSIVGKTILESALRKHFGITVVAIKRGQAIISDIGAETQLLQNDIIYVFGKPEDIISLNNKIKF